MHQSDHLVGCYAVGTIVLLNCYLNALRCLNLLHQAMSLTYIINPGSSASKLTSSKLIVLRSTLRIPISSLKNVAQSESSLTEIISSLENKSSSSF